MLRNTYIPLFIAALLLAGSWSCTRKNEACNSYQVIRATADTLVYAGDTLRLHVSPVEGAAFYNWYGPGGFSTHEKDPIITNLTIADAGKYTVDVITGEGCTYTATTDSVKVIIPNPPCTLTNNYVQMDKYYKGSVSSVSAAPAYNTYRVDATWYYGHFYVDFNGINPPKQGIYDIDGAGGPISEGHVQITLYDGFSSWYGSIGKVYVSVSASGKITIGCCSLRFFNSMFNYADTGSFQFAQR